MQVRDSNCWRLFINGQEAPVTNLRSLCSRIAKGRRKQFADVQMVFGQLPEHNLFALFNRHRAVISYSFNIDEACWSARDSEGTGSENPMLEFYLSNGQCDEYPWAETVPAGEAVKAFEYLFLNAELPSWIKWHKDV
jgi:hypothetical protein